MMGRSMKAIGNQINHTTEADRFMRMASTIQVATKMACIRDMELNNSRMVICIKVTGNKAQLWDWEHFTITMVMFTRVVLSMDDRRDMA